MTEQSRGECRGVLNPQAVNFLAELAASAGETTIGAGTPEAAREGNAQLLQIVGEPGPEVRSVSDFEILGQTSRLAARAYAPPSGGPGGVIVYYHGGGWVTGDLESHDAICRHLALLADCDVVNVNYRHAPEHPFPAAADDAFDAAAWVHEHMCEGRPLVVAGDSAGGNLAAATALRARDEGGPPIALQVLLYPVLDHDFTTRSYEELSEGFLLGRSEMRWFWDQYLPDERARDNPYASPLRARELAGVAPAILLLAEFDPLRDEGHAYGERLREVAVAVDESVWEGMLHGFLSFPRVFDAAGDGVRYVGNAIREHLGKLALTASANGAATDRAPGGRSAPP